MEVEFATTRLQKCYEKYGYAVRSWGEKVARRYVQRVDLIHACATHDDLGRIPQLRLHPLKGERAGQWAITLTGMARLILTFRSGRSGTIARIEEVSKHYGD